jgi:undecaprenol kinase/diacylglycerol kinase (ATP)
MRWQNYEICINPEFLSDIVTQLTKSVVKIEAMLRLIKSFGYAFKGFWFATKTQLNFRIHLVATVVVTALGFYLKLQQNEWLWISLAITMVLTAELFNTAIETLTDRVSPEYNVKAGQTKDAAAAAVTITVVFAVVVGAIILLPKVIAILR